MKTALMLAALSAAGRAKQDNDYGPLQFFSTELLPEYFPNLTQRSLIQSANEHPNLTRSAKFKPFENFWPALSENSSLRNSEWIWRINVTDFPAPDFYIRSSDHPVPNPHVVSTTYDFSWPAGNASTAFDDAKTLCMTTLLGVPFDFPANVSNAFTEDQKNSADCGPVLGKACVDAIYTDVITATASGGCTGSPGQWWSLPECASTFGYARSTVQSMGLATTPLVISPVNDSTIQSNSTQGSMTAPWALRRIRSDSTQAPMRAPWTSGGMFYEQLSEQFTGSNSTTYLGAANQLRVLLMVARLQAQEAGKYVQASQILCMRANASHLSTNADFNKDGVTTTIEAANATSGSSMLSLNIRTFLCLIVIFALLSGVFN